MDDQPKYCGVVWEFPPLTQSIGQTACDKRGAGNVFVTPAAD